MGLILKYHNRKQVEEVIERMARLALAHKLEEISGLEKPVMKEGNTEYTGIEDINRHVDQLEKEASQWWYCDCWRKSPLKNTVNFCEYR